MYSGLGKKKSKMSHVLGHHNICLIPHLRYGIHGPVIMGMCFNREG